MAGCHFCTTIATDPDKGPSRWARAVRGGQQVLVCPDCQDGRPGWLDEMESCPVCGSKRLSKQLGDRVCRSCHHSWSDDRGFTLG